MKEMFCLRCGKEMRSAGREKLQLGETGWILGDLPNLFAGAMEVDIYLCSGCGKVEFFSSASHGEELPQKQCPNCGKTHDFDCPKCPFCKYDYYARHQTD